MGNKSTIGVDTLATVGVQGVKKLARTGRKRA